MSRDALDLALALHAQPSLIGVARAQGLPAGVTQLLRLALAHEQTTEDTVAATGLPARQLNEAARFFIEQLMLAREFQDDPWRILGVAAGADIERIREHHRLLVRLVHPDRSDEWASAYAERVNKSWRQLRHEGGRQEALASKAHHRHDDFGPGHDIRGSTNDTGDAWAMSTTPVPRASVEVIHASTPTATQSPARYGGLGLAFAGLALVAVTISAGFWLGFQRGQQQTGPVATVDTSDTQEALVSEVAAIDLSAPPTEAALATAKPAATLPLVAEAIAPPLIEAPTASTAPANTIPASVPPGAPASLKPLAATLAPVKAPRIRPVHIEAPAETESEAIVAAEPLPAEVESPVQTPPLVAAAVLTKNAGPTRAEAVAVLDAYMKRYAEGDLGGVLSLFAREIHAQDRRVAAIANEHSRLFEETRDRGIAMRDLRWQRDGERMLGSGQYQARFRPKNRLRYETIVGSIEFELVNEAGSARLIRLNAKPGKRS